MDLRCTLPAARATTAPCWLAAALSARCTLRYEHVGRDFNTDADALSNAAMDAAEAMQGADQAALVAAHAAFQKSLMAKGLVLEQLCKLVRKVHGRPWAPGHTVQSTSLTPLGGSVVRCVSQRAVLSAATQDVLRRLQEHTAGGAHATAAFYPDHMAWAATFYPQQHYEPTWQQRAAQWRVVSCPALKTMR